MGDVHRAKEDATRYGPTESSAWKNVANGRFPVATKPEPHREYASAGTFARCAQSQAGLTGEFLRNRNWMAAINRRRRRHEGRSISKLTRCPTCQGVVAERSRLPTPAPMHG